MTSDSYFTLGFYVRKPQTDRAEYPIFARISVAGQATEFKIGRTVDPDNWDAKKHLCRGRTRRDLELNKYLEMVRAKLCDIHNMLIRENKPVNPAILKSLFLGNGEKGKMMVEVFREANEHRKEEYERGDIVKATYQRWTRCADYIKTMKSIDSAWKRYRQLLYLLYIYCEWSLTVNNAEKCRKRCNVEVLKAKLR